MSAPDPELVSRLSSLSPEAILSLQQKNRVAWKRQLSEQRLASIFPDSGPLRRELYPKHTAFFAAGGRHEPMPWCPSDCDGSGHQERSLIAGNRTGKTLSVCYELTRHLIGTYPHWWAGRRFDGPITSWAAGEDAKAVRESLQAILMGPPEAIGTGLIPKSAILDIATRQGVSGSIDVATIANEFGGASRLLFKTYDQGRESFQAAAVDVMVFDEEPPEDIYSEGLTRTMSTVPGKPNGLVMCSFTPLSGLSNVVLGYLPGGKPGGNA